MNNTYLISLKRPITVVALRTSNDQMYATKITAFESEKGDSSPINEEKEALFVDVICGYDREGTAVQLGRFKKEFSDYDREIPIDKVRERFWSPANRVPLTLRINLSNIDATSYTN